ncbi:MAG: DNA mismatch repair endonuclease MutL [Bacteroidales bacterium]|nr:DNA mismatch repair endonuclease MutL [Bacteroidales bacterium]
MNDDVIRLLPDSVANQIAAGEVIQRPASVIKELVENSIDAGATSVQIVIKDAGRTLIQVIDNGGGMSPTDARMAFERHATSKIQQADDLFTLHTMGFRGEALPSIAAVAQIELRTMRRGDEVGTRLRISESRFEGQEPATCVPGTNLMVKNLFFHMPARRKFLKKDSVELGHIMHEFERLALVNTDVEFSITHNDVLLHSLPHGTLKQRIASLFGKTAAGQLIPVGTETSVVRISGYIGSPQHARKRGVPQYFFVNGRNMRHPYFHRAVLNCYAELISPDVQPAYFINFEVDPATIDVNIHPQKHEIKFENEQSIWQILTAAVKQSLGRINAAGAIDFDAEQAPEIPVFMPDPDTPMPGIATTDGYNPFVDGYDSPSPSPAPAARPTGNMIERPSRASVPHDWQKLYDSFAARRDSDEPADVRPQYYEAESAMSSVGPQTQPDDNPRLIADEAVPVGCMALHNRYLVLTARNGLMVIDRRRAHVRVLFERFLASLRASSLVTQKLIFPEILTLSPGQSAILSAVTDMLAGLGFDIAFLGDNSWAVNGVPALPGNASPAETITRILSDLEETGELPEAGLLEPAALILARSAAINPGRKLSDEENDTLVADLFRTTQPDFTPDGQRIISVITHDQLSKLFV